MTASQLFILLDTALQSLSVRPIYVGFSGGLDSSVLLHALCRRIPADQVVAIHINHRLSPHSDAWEEHCRRVCERLGCGFASRSVTVDARGEGLEAAARKQRYQSFDALVPNDHALWLAHHLDDQLETFMQRLLRGSGLNGLSAMEAHTQRMHYQLVRPLLTLPRAGLEAFATDESLTWIEDGSNEDLQHDRNYLRHQILPLIEARWPRYRQTMSRSLQYISQAGRELDMELTTELDKRLAHDGALKAVQLADWPDDRIQSLIHLWLRRQGVRPPSAVQMRRILNEVVRAQPDAQPRVDFGEGSVRRFRTALYWVPHPAEPGLAPACPAKTQVHWPGIGDLRLESASYGSNRLRQTKEPLRLALRRGGEALWPAGRSKPRDLKRLLQEYRLPPWQRDRLPLLYAGDDLVAVADLCIDRSWLAEEGEPGWLVHFQQSMH